MDINDDCGSRSRILNNLADDGVVNEESVLEEQKSSTYWPANGMRKQPLVEVNDNYSLGSKDLVDEAYSGNVYDFQASYCEGHLNDLMNFNNEDREATYSSKSNDGQSYDSSNKYARFNHLPLLSEVLRISRILRRLMLESNRKSAVDLCKKLDAAVRNQSNSTYICRSFDILFDNMITVLRQCPPECLEHASEILGIMGYINRSDFFMYKINLTKAYGNIKTIRKYLMIALRTTISCDAVNLDLKAHSESLLSQLKEYLENAEVAENFMAISETICELSKHYQHSFQRHFTDIVDIIIGWHLEAEQPGYLKRHCARILQRLADYFLNELEFTLGLLGQFIEDIDACGEEIMAEEALIKAKQQTEARIGAFIGAFTSIMKALVSKGVGLNHFTVSPNILPDAKRVVNNVATRCFKAVATVGEETVLNLNEFYCVISSYDKSVENLRDLEIIMELELQHLYGFNDNQLASFLYMILNIVRQYRTQLPLNFVSMIMKKDNLALRQLMLTVGSKSYNLLLRTYHEILIIKNVPLLQEAYRHILKDVNETIAHLKTNHAAVFSVARSELILGFYLSALSALACQTSSIIGMYALNPSILELLVANCQAANQDLWTKYPTLYNSLLGVIIEHSNKNHNFRQSSRLLSPHQDSPSSENFGIILNFLASQMQWDVSTQIIDWVEKLLEDCHEYSNTLTKHDDFLAICNNVINLTPKEPMICSKVLSAILKYPNIPDDILSKVKDTTLCVIPNCGDDQLAAYCQLLALLPLQISLSAGSEAKLFYNAKEKSRELQHWHQTTAYYSRLRPKFFKAFVDTFEPNSNNNDYLYQSFVDKSAIYQPKEQVTEYLMSVQQNCHMRQRHIQYEAARFCVLQKLRTPLGKPQETFLAIEAIIMKYAHLLSEKQCPAENLRGLDNAMGIQQNCQMLLGFLDDLEKHIYNAAEGTAFAMLPAEKPSKTFFRVNVSTCAEWFKRIRTAVNLIAIHCMAPEIVIRNCEHILLNESDLANRGFRDRTVTSMVWALFACSESDTMLGLQSWLKEKHYDGYEWIQHVAEHTSGHFEKAAAGYFKLLNTENSKSLDLYTREFMQKQLSECLSHILLWSDLANTEQDSFQMKFQWKILESISQRSFNNQSLTADRKCLETALLEMTAWKNLEKDEIIPQAESFSSYEVLRTLKNVFIASAVSTTTAQNNLHDKINNCLRQGLRVGLLNRYEPDSYNHQLNEILLLNHVSLNLQQHTNISISSEVNEIPSAVLNDSFAWSIIMGHGKQEPNMLLLLNAASKARMDGNLNYCQSLLERFFSCKGLDKPLSQITAQMKLNELVVDYNDTEMIRAIEELMKHMYAQSSSAFDALELGSACCFQLVHQQAQAMQPQNALPSSALNMLLTLSDWLTTNRLQTNSGRQLQNLQNTLPDISFCVNTDQRMSNMLPPSEYGVGKLLNASVLCDGESGEAWLSFANWCYRWGKKLMETSGNDQQVFDRKNWKLTNRSISSIREVLGDNLNDEQMERLLDLLNTHMTRAIDDDAMERVGSHSQNTTELLESEIKKCCNISTDHISAIVSIWRQAQKGVYGFYEEATTAYFKYLSIQSNASMNKKKSSSEVEDSTFVTTTLRLLRLIVKHAIGLQNVLEDGLRNTPLRPWKVIVPQLFSRLNHHEPYVRQSVSDLLCRLAINQPQLIIFPAVVGAQQELKNSDNADSQIQLTNCFVSLLSTLSQQAPDVVLQVQLLVKELRRITLLWEEHWVQSLAQLYAEYSPLYNALEAESKKTSDKEMMTPKYEIFRQHLLTDFKQIASLTANEPETYYERSFQERFKSHIDILLKELQKASDSTKPAEYWQKIRQLYNIFLQRPLRGNSSTLRVSDISPVLANMRNTSIAMPGIDTYEQTSIYIKSVDSAVFILPTKTKPKKLSFIGSNGQSYTFLFKGQEDLHLDERIMQFLSIANSMMVRSYGSKSNTDCFKAHHYSVIPLGSQSGLISWVQNCTPLFAIYKKWQQREATLKQQQKERQSSKSSDIIAQSPVTTNTLRPSELFYNKLTPQLAERNIKISDPRRQWPMSVLKRVLKELCAETPKDLLSKEIWCCSANSVDWRLSVRRYTMSLAVMSVIGYVIGLGDRHLDNILIKLGTGEIVHIDYNVCFEKGKSLRVPEKVPFRMSQNIKDALGLVGIEGPFRLACSHVLKILRKERETLLTLLEAFVYDPLVDWTVTDDGATTSSRGTSAHSAAVLIASVGASKELDLSPKDTYKSRKHDVDLCRQALALKITEIKPAWLKYKNDFDLQLANIDAHVESLLDLRRNMVRLEQERSNFTKQQAMVQELDALGSARGSHALNTVSLRYQYYKKDLDSFMKTKQLVLQTIKDLDLVSSTYFNILLRPEEIMNIDLTSINHGSAGLNDLNEFELVRDLLVRNNCHDVYMQAMYSKAEMDNNIPYMQIDASECRDLLLFYSRIMRFYPRCEMQHNHLLKYRHEYAKLVELDENNPNACNFREDDRAPCKVNQCQRYFENLIMTLADIQTAVAQVNRQMEEHKYQEVTDTTESTAAFLRGFYNANTSTQRNRQVVLVAAMRQIQKAYELFALKDRDMVANQDYFLLDHRHCFMQIVASFVYHVNGAIKNLQCPKELQLFINALHSLCNLRNSFEYLCEKIASIFVTENITQIDEEVLSDPDCLKRYPEYDAAYKESDMLFSQAIISLQMLQERLSYLQELHPNDFIDKIMNCWNTNISQYLAKCRSELLIKLISGIKGMTQSYMTNDFDNAYDIRKIMEPIQAMVLSIEHKLFDGLLAYIVQVVTLSISDMLTASESVSERDIEESYRLCEKLFVAIQNEASAQSDELVIRHNSMLMEHHSMVATAYYWLNESQLGGVPSEHALYITTKQQFLSNLRFATERVDGWKSSIIKTHFELEGHRKNINELLKPTIASTTDSCEDLLKFNDVVAAADQSYVFYVKLATRLTEYAAVIMQFEMSGDDDGPFESLVKQFNEARDRLRTTETTITNVERNLVQLLDPEGKIDQCWIQNISDLLDEMIFATQKNLGDLEKEATLVESVLRNDGQKLQLILDSSIRTELRQLIKMITKSGKQAIKAENGELFHSIRDIQQAIKLQQIKLNELQMLMFLREFETSALCDIKSKVDELCSHCQKNNRHFGTLIEHFLNLDLDKKSVHRYESPARNDTENDGKDVAILNSQVGEQKRNAYAVSVWKRIRMKLEGRDPDPNRRSSVAEQIDYVIGEATNEDNLATLYEGWTPWV